MRTVSRVSLLAAATGLACAAAIAKPPMAHDAPAASDEQIVASAMTAAPAKVSADATVVAAQPDGTLRTVRAGSNGWTCMADNPTTPGPDPMCMDRNAGAWAAAWMGKKTPPSETPGIMYMLAGGTDASNTDPYAKAPTAGGDWVKTGPHLMVVGSSAVLAGYPSGPSPDTKAPYVMWAGTPYAHLMIPVER